MKTIYATCVDPERGKYLAFNDEGGIIMIAESFASSDDAVGRLVTQNPDLFDIRVVLVGKENG